MGKFQQENPHWPLDTVGTSKALGLPPPGVRAILLIDHQYQQTSGTAHFALCPRTSPLTLSPLSHSLFPL